MIDIFIILLIISEIILVVKIYNCLERIEDDMVDIELTYERMRKVITYLKDCIEHSGNQ